VTTDDVQALREAVDSLQAAYDRRRAEFAVTVARIDGAVPEDMRDSAGRSILLDALVALVNARTALLNAGVAL
jgi:hypothetical protein